MSAGEKRGQGERSYGGGQHLGTFFSFQFCPMTMNLSYFSTFGLFTSLDMLFYISQKHKNVCTFSNCSPCFFSKVYNFHYRG